MPTNHAAYLVEAKKYPLEVREAPYPSAEDGKLVVRNHAVAINPVDWKIQTYERFPLKYPAILGEDSAGEVVEVGSGVDNFRKGQRVICHCLGLGGDSNQSGFQEYVVVSAFAAAPLPSSVSYEQGVVLPLAISTAAAGLFQEDYLSLPHPSESAKDTGKTILIWGGSSSVGTAAIQLARASGLEVISTASKRNFDLVKKLGAAQVFDRSSSSVVDDIIAALKGKHIVGAYDAISEEDTQRACADILVKSDAANKFIALVLGPKEGLPSEVTTKSVFAPSIFKNDVGGAVWGEYLPGALESGHFKTAPDPLVVGTGLDHIQEAMDKNKAGMSAAKAVVKLS